jgi:hypothetical protein
MCPCALKSERLRAPFPRRTPTHTRGCVPLQWPGVILQLFRLMSVFNFNIDITAPECTLKQLTYETKWWIVMQLPVGAAALFFVIFLVNAAVKRLYLGIKQRKRVFSHKNALIGMLLVILYFLYLYLCVPARLRADPALACCRVAWLPQAPLPPPSPHAAKAAFPSHDPVSARRSFYLPPHPLAPRFVFLSLCLH